MVDKGIFLLLNLLSSCDLKQTFNQIRYMGEADWIKASAKNDKTAQRSLFEQYYNDIISLCTRYAKSTEQAEEMALSGMHKVFEQIKRYNPAETSFLDWIKKIVVVNNIAILKSNMQEYYIVSTVKAIDNSLFVSSSNAEELENNEWFLKCDASKIIPAIQHLPPSLRVSYNMFSVDGFKVSDVAEHLEISEATAQSNIEKARNTLKRNLFSEYKLN
jgi:RNA polymerase sigma factor (sigma-70 family)